MRILSIITNQLIVKKQILENEIVAKLAEINSTILTWESYINKEQQKQN